MKLKYLFLAALCVFQPALANAAGVVVVGSGTAVEALDEDAIKRLFLGRESSLAGRPLVLVMQKSGETRARFDANVLGRPGAQLTSYWSKLVFTGKAKAPEEVTDDAAVKARVASTPGAIGYISASAVDSTVKVVHTF
jgi:ABC-type phosphate transport system substrate-binding protein